MKVWNIFNNGPWNYVELLKMGHRVFWKNVTPSPAALAISTLWQVPNIVFFPHTICQSYNTFYIAKQHKATYQIPWMDWQSTTLSRKQKHQDTVKYWDELKYVIHELRARKNEWKVWFKWKFIKIPCKLAIAKPKCTPRFLSILHLLSGSWQGWGIHTGKHTCTYSK